MNRHLAEKMECCESIKEVCGCLTDTAVGKCKIARIVISILISMFDVGTNWYNYHEFSSYRSSLGSAKDMYRVFVDVILAISILGSIFFLVEVSLAYKRLRRAARGEEESHAHKASWQFISLLISTFEDLPMVGIYFLATILRFCPVIAQFRTVAGFVTVIASAVSACWRLMYSCACCSWCRSKHKRKKSCSGWYCCQWCLRLSHAPTQAFTIILVVFVIISTRGFESVAIGFRKGRPTAPLGNTSVYLSQQVLAQYQAGNTTCNSFHVGAKLFDLNDISSSATDDKIVRVLCSELSPYYQSLFESPFDDDSKYVCYIVIIFIYSELLLKLEYYYGFEMHSIDLSHRCEKISRNDVRQRKAITHWNLWTNTTREAICRDDLLCKGVLDSNDTQASRGGVLDHQLYVSTTATSGDLVDICPFPMYLFIPLRVKVTIPLCERTATTIKLTTEYITCSRSSKWQANVG